MGRDGPEVSPERMRVVSITLGQVPRRTPRSTRRTCSSGSTPGCPSETLGDMNYEHEFTNASYVDARQRHPVSHRLALAPGLGRQLRRAGRDRGPQRLRRIAQGRQGQRVSRPGGGSRVSAIGDLPDARGRRDARRRRVPAGAAARTTASPSSSRASSPCSTRRSARRAASPSSRRSCGAFPTNRSGSWSTRISTSTTPADCAPTTTSAPRVDHALEELRLPQPRRDQLRAAHAAARHGVALAADRAGRGLLLRDRQGELRHQRRHPHDADPLREPAPARRRAC